MLISPFLFILCCWCLRSFHFDHFSFQLTPERGNPNAHSYTFLRLRTFEKQIKSPDGILQVGWNTVNKELESGSCRRFDVESLEWWMELFIHSEVISQGSLLCLIEQSSCITQRQIALVVSCPRYAALHIHQNLSFNRALLPLYVTSSSFVFLLGSFCYEKPIQIIIYVKSISTDLFIQGHVLAVRDSRSDRLKCCSVCHFFSMMNWSLQFNCLLLLFFISFNSRLPDYPLHQKKIAHLESRKLKHISVLHT